MLTEEESKMTAQYHPSNMTEEEHTTRMDKNHNCNLSDFISQCCGAGSYEYVETWCARCHDDAEFACIDCGKLEGEN